MGQWCIFLKCCGTLTGFIFSDCLYQSLQIDVRNMGIIFPDGAEEKEQAAPDVQRSKLRPCLCLCTIIIISISGFMMFRII